MNCAPDWCGHNGQRDEDRDRAVGSKQDDHWPEHVELLFDGQRPEMGSIAQRSAIIQQVQPDVR